MTISELIKHVGDENVEFQLLESSLISAQVKKRDGEITFATDRNNVLALAGLGKPTHRCMILWLPLDRMPKPE